VHDDAGSVDLLAEGRMAARFADDLTHAVEQLRIIERERARGYPIALELPRLAKQSRCMGEGAHRDRTIVGRHAAELIARDERGLRAQVRRTQRGRDAGGTRAEHEDVLKVA
jgi:hypothetical protein